ncbi:MAG: hypothetical protein A2017_11510 [Lentisphaerae bacterium GWF2_44_16]|nr:MAG: hypothetical protein A2017_11510 [Lentisphaerae bacterium GWF2_44_16]
MDTWKFTKKAGLKSKTIIIATIVSLLPILSIPAQNTPQENPPPDKKETVTQDYSKGFAVFYKLGLADVSKAEYINLNSRVLQLLYPLVQRPFQTKGNAWLLKGENGTSPASFIVFNAVSLEAYDGRKLFEEFKKKSKKDSKLDPRKEYLEFLAENKSKVMAFWEKVDIKEDIEGLLSQLAEMDKDNFSYQKELTGPAFLYAIQIYSKGFKNEANKIISRLFELAGDKKIVLLSAMSCLANQQYGQALFDLEENGDWKKFGTALELLLKKYPQGWIAAPGIKLLQEMVQKQIANPVPPEIKGEGVSEEDKKLAAELLSVKEIPRSGDIDWLFPENEKLNEFQDETIKKIMSKGMKAIPMLIALLKDDYMVRVSGNQNYFRTGNDEKSAEGSLSMIPHPIKRKDIAKALLLQSVTLSEKSEDFNVMALNDEQLIEICGKWYEEIKTKTPDELSLYYLKNGLNHQKYFAIMSLMKGDLNKKSPVIEEFFLNIKKEELMSFLEGGPLSEYVVKRKKAAIPFVEKLKAKFKTELAAAEEDKKKEKKDLTKKKDTTVKVDEDEKDGDSDSFLNDPLARKNLKKCLDSLTELAKEKNAKQIVDEMLSDKKKLKDRTAYSQLMSVLKEMDRDEALGLLLYATLKTGDNIPAKGSFISLIAMVGRIDEYPSEQENKKNKKPLSLEKNAEAWKKLLADKTMLRNYKINVLAALFIENLYGNKENLQKLSNLQNVLGERCNSIVMKRAEERLAGKTEKELTPYPEIKDLDEEASKKLVASLEKALAEKKVKEFMNSIGDSEFAALPKLVSKNPKLNAGFRDYANRIVSAKSQIKGEEKALDAFNNTVLDRKTVDKIQDYCKKLTAEKKLFACNIMKKPLFGGVDIELSDPGEYMEMPENRREENSNIPLYMSGGVSVGSNYAHAQWEISAKNEKEGGNEIVVNGKKIKLEKADERGMKRSKQSQDKFLKCLEKAFGDEADSTDIIIINYGYMHY